MEDDNAEVFCDEDIANIHSDITCAHFNLSSETLHKTTDENMGCLASD